MAYEPASPANLVRLAGALTDVPVFLHRKRMAAWFMFFLVVN